MYHIHLCRYRGKGACYPKFNIKRKGVFIKDFKTLDDLVRYLIHSGGKIAMTQGQQDIPPKDWKIFVNKYRSYDYKQYLRSAGK